MVRFSQSYLVVFRDQLNLAGILLAAHELQLYVRLVVDWRSAERHQLSDSKLGMH